MVSHLFFAYDTILFTQTNNDEAEEIKGLIKHYEQTSKQRINLENIKFTMSTNISVEKRKELSTILGVKDVNKHMQYLGLPTLIGRS